MAGAERSDDGPVLLSGGNPQIPKGDGEAPVKAYIEAMPGWKREVGEQLDTVITETIPEVRKAVRWNSPFYGTESNHWFLSFHCFTSYVKVAFLNGQSLDPLPPVDSRDENTRYLHIEEGGEVDRTQLAEWIQTAAAIPGWDGF